MKRSIESSTSTLSPKPAKRQASLAGFLQPKSKITPTSPRTVKSTRQNRIEQGDGKSEDKPITLVEDEDQDENKDDVQNQRPSPGIILNKGKSKAVEYKSTDEDLSINWPSTIPNHPYHLPPNPTFNHPFTLSQIPSNLKPINFNVHPQIIHNPTTELDLLYYKGFIDPALSTKPLMDYLLNELPWYRVKYTVRGININTPRYTTVFGKDSTIIPWTGYQKCNPRAIPEVLQRLMRKVEQVTSSTFNFCLVNYYSSGVDSISYHSDSESFLGPNPTIASLTLGYPRDFLLRHVNYKNHPRTGKAVEIEKFVLEDGDMVVMKGRTQHEWQHSIPKRKLAKGRINITFRKGIVKYATENYYQYNVGKGELYRWDKSIGEMKEVK
ncbi:uncharacterized protein IL334_004166 [Kwoniella shivajii]|uniref:Fe2OG dioxygenase domain-containing protein n=1 Tax=Kwoniella shivajii TaxID=564305 RepID=A0ABZ1CZZ6_9TREE|nr:hypothetical protein IL334_004166 [Kwoniella shivajii]